MKMAQVLVVLVFPICAVNPSPVSAIVLDAGALIALERNHREVWAALKVAALRSTEVVVPSAVFAQVWRGTPSQAQLGHEQIVDKVSSGQIKIDPCPD